MIVGLFSVQLWQFGLVAKILGQWISTDGRLWNFWVVICGFPTHCSFWLRTMHHSFVKLWLIGCFRLLCPNSWFYLFQLKNCGNSRKKARARGTRAVSSQSARLPSAGCTTGEVITYSGRGPLVRPPVSCSKAQGSLNLLKDLRKIQTTLRQDDIVWDC